MVYFREILKVIFLGIVEGITEWLPISSTGHMLLVDEFLTLKAVDEEFKEMFFISKVNDDFLFTDAFKMFFSVN